MLKKLVFLLVVFTLHFQISAQEYSSVAIQNSDAATSEVLNYDGLDQNYNQDFNQYWSFGGSLGFSFWDDQTSILLAPKAYYNVTPKFLTGFGITYIYSDYDSGLFDFKSNSFGGSVMGAFRPIPNLQIDAEYEGIQTNRSGGIVKEEFWNNALYLGASFIAGKVSFGFRYDVLYDDYKSVYASAFNPVIGFYF